MIKFALISGILATSISVAAAPAWAGVESAGTKLSGPAENAGAAIDDATITTKVKAAILAQSGLKTLQIHVKTSNGVVTLSGNVDTQAHSDLAASMAGAVSGVSQVTNHLVVKPGK